MRLICFLRSSSQIIFDLEYSNGQIHINYVKPTNIRDDVARWIRWGLIEIIRDDDDEYAHQRVTKSSSPFFLPHLKDYIEKMGFNSKFIRDGVQIMAVLEDKFADRDWFHSIGQDQSGRVVVYIKYTCLETLNDIPDEVDGKQVLVHFAAAKLATREQYTDDPSKKKVDRLTLDVNALIRDVGKEKAKDIFYEVHDGVNAVTQFSDRFPYARDCMEKLYEEYGFDVLFDLLDHG